MIDEFQKQYELLELIGEGGLAAVYKVRQKASSTVYAFKKLKDNFPLNLDALNTEYLFLNSCRHPGIVNVIDFIKTENECGLISELVEGDPLQLICGKLNDTELFAAMTGIFDIAAFIHQSGYIYNDYKPQNFIRRSDGSLKLIDFNLTKKIDSGSMNNCGTLEYLAPEIIRGGRISILSDIYSLGVTIYELITGRLPFAAANQDGLIKAIAELPPNPLTGQYGHWNAAMQQVLSKTPADRPGTIYEMARIFGFSLNLESAIKNNAKYYLRLSLADPPKEPIDKKTTSAILGQILKKYALDNEFISKMENWSGGDEQIIYDYILHFIDTDYIKFSAKGWVLAKSVEPSILPGAVLDRHLEKLASLSYDEMELLGWFSILNRPLANTELMELSALEAGRIGMAIDKLSESQIIICGDNRKYRIINQSILLAVLTQIRPDKLSQMHNRAAQYLAFHEPSNYQSLTQHYGQIPDFIKTLESGYLAASQLLKADDLKQGSYFLELAINAQRSLPIGYADNNRIAELFLLAGDFAKKTAENKAAEKHYIEAIEFAAKSTNQKLSALICKNLGDLYRRDQRSAESIEYSQKALESFRSMGDRPMEAACLNNLSLAYWLAGEYKIALEYLDKALKINEELGDLLEQSKIHSNIGFISDLVGNTGQVLVSLHKALECATKVGNHYQEMVSLNNIGFFYLNTGNPQKALEYFDNALKIALQRNFVDQQLNLESNIAWAYHEMGNIIKSAEANQKTLDIALRNQHELFAAQSSYLLARDCLAMGNFRLADQMLSQARKICADISNNDLAIDILLGQIELSLATGDSIRAGQLLDEFAGLKNPGKKQLLIGNLYRAKYLSLQGDNSAAQEYGELIERITDTEFADIAISAAIDLARILLEQNQTVQVQPLISELISQNVLTSLQLKLVKAELFGKLRQFDDCLDLIKEVKSQAESSGCMPEYFRASLAEAEIYRACGKNSNLQKIIARLNKMYQSIQRTFPEDRRTASIENVKFIKQYLKLVALYTDKAVMVKA